MRDPLAALEFGTATYGRLARQLVHLARACSGAPLLLVLEGGYDAPSLADSVVATMQGLADQLAAAEEEELGASDDGPLPWFAPGEPEEENGDGEARLAERVRQVIDRVARDHRLEP